MTPPPPVEFVPSAPLGGRAPIPPVAEVPSQRRELMLTAALLVYALVAGAASMLPWRDFGRQLGRARVETGWEGPGGVLGRGWVAVALAVGVAVGGVLIAAERGRAGRTVATVAGAGLAVLAVAEWGVGAGSLRVGPGVGLWVLLAVGVAVVVTVGALAPRSDSDPIDRLDGRGDATRT